jgi:hypothetical protein
MEECLDRWALNQSTFEDIAKHVADNKNYESKKRAERSCYRFVKKHLEKQQKCFLDFTGIGEVAVYLDTTPRTKNKKFNGIVCVGKTGSGKSYNLIHQFLLHDQYKKKARYYLFTAVTRTDPSLQALVKYANKNEDKPRFFKVKLDPNSTEPLPLSLSDYSEGDFLLFDDISSFPRGPEWKNLAADVMSLQHICSERGRHEQINCASTSHHLKDYSRTKKIMNSSSWLMVFPRSNSTQFVNQFLVDDLGLGRHEADRLTTQMRRESRWCLFHAHVPRFFLNDKTIRLM